MLINFDFDGVIVDSIDHITEIISRAQTKIRAGRPIQDEDLRSLENHTFPDMARRLNIPEDMIPEFATAVFDFQKSDTYLPNVFPEMPRVLTQISRQHKIAVITSSVEEQVRRVLDQYSLDKCISLVLGGDSSGSKSDKIHRARELFGVNREDTYIIGDTRGDIHQGKEANVGTIAVTWGYQSREILMLESPDYIVDLPDDLLKILA